MSRANRLLPWVAATLLAAAASVQAAPPSTVDEIVARHVAARGGLKKIRSVETLRQSGRATAGPNRNALVTRELKRPSKSRFEFTVQGVTGVYVSDGQRGWQVAPFEGDVAPQPLSEDVVSEAAEQADVEGPLVDWKAKGHQVELAGREILGGREAYKLKLTLKSGAIRYEYLDTKTFRLVRSDSTRTVRGRPVRLMTTFSDFKKTGGVLFPRAIEVAVEGRPSRLKVVVEKIELNPPLSDARFAPAVPPEP